MSDLINRQDVLELIDDYNSDGLGSVFFSYVDGEKFKKAILALTSVQKTGKWITKSDTNPYYTAWWYECSECGQKPLQDGYEQEVLSDYCPSCGARMEGEEE